jgi:hypothetical protein
MPRRIPNLDWSSADTARAPNGMVYMIQSGHERGSPRRYWFMYWVTSKAAWESGDSEYGSGSAARRAAEHHYFERYGQFEK